MPPYKVLVVEDEQIIRKNIVSKVNGVGDAFTVCADVSNGREAWEQIRRLHPHVVLIDINIPEIDGLELARNIKNQYPKVISVIITGYSSFDYAKQAIGYGAFDYLLKPVKQLTLSEVFERIKLRLDVRMLGNARDIVCIGGDGENADMLPFRQPGKLDVMLLCAGNLAALFPSAAQSRLHETLWAQLDIQRLIAENWRGPGVLWLIDEIVDNEKLLLFSSLPDAALEAFAGALFAAASGAIAPYPVHLLKGGGGVYYSDIWNRANLLRGFAEKRFVAGRSEIVDIGQSQTAPAAPLQQDTLLKLNVLLRNDTEAFRYELEALMVQWSDDGRSQRTAEAQLSKLLQFVLSQGTTAEPHSDIERDLALSAALAPDPATWAWEASDILVSLIGTESIQGAENIASQVKAYLDQHFTQPVIMEDIARHFAFSQTYLTRIFKKYCGTTPVKYLIALRIDKAKQILAEHPSIDVKEVAQSVGYDDQHYFSRIFRSATGQSPSEYRNGCDFNA